MGKITLANIELAERELLRRAVRNARPREGKRVRWGVIGALFALGSTSSMRLCEEFKVDPHEMIGKDVE